MKKLTALILALAMMLALAACTGGGNNDDGSRFAGIDPTAPLTKDDVIDFMVESSASWPIRDDWKIWEYMAEGSGATLNLIAVPASDAATKYLLMFAAPDELPDVIGFGMSTTHSKYAGEGLIAFDDLSQFMPNYNAWIESLTEEQYNVAVKPRKRADGKVYYTPGSGREGKTRMRAWLYREDIFKKHNLKAPETFDELYDVCKQLKALYPDSYPFCTRSMSYMFDIPGSSFDKWWSHLAYYDQDDGEWRWGAIEDTAIEVVSFYKKMIEEKLMPADTHNLNNTTWEEFMLTDKGFILPHLQLRIDYFNQLAHQAGNTEYKIQAFAPPVANPEKGAAMIERGDLEMIGFSICDSGDDQKIANAAKFIDWMYTDQGMEYVSWGKEGETYEVVDGKKKFITDDKQTPPNTMYGFQLYGTFCRLDPAAAEAMQSETTLESEDLVIAHTLPEYPVTLWLDYNDEEQAVIDTYLSGIQTYSEEMLIKFVLGQEPISKFDEFVENLKSMGLDEVLAAYESAYNRVK